MTEQEPKRHYVGEVLGTQPAIKRVSRRVAFRGYRVFVVVGIKEDGTVEQSEFFKPAFQYDRGYFASSKWLPHQGKRECARRLKQQERE